MFPRPELHDFHGLIQVPREITIQGVDVGWLNVVAPKETFHDVLPERTMRVDTPIRANNFLMRESAKIFVHLNDKSQPGDCFDTFSAINHVIHLDHVIPATKMGPARTQKDDNLQGVKISSHVDLT